MRKFLTLIYSFLLAFTVLTPFVTKDVHADTVYTSSKTMTLSAIDENSIFVFGNGASFTLTASNSSYGVNLPNGNGQRPCSIKIDANTGKITYTYTPTTISGTGTQQTQTEYPASGHNAWKLITVYAGPVGYQFDFQSCYYSVNVAPTYSAPTAKTLTYTGSNQTLANAGSVTAGGTMQYALGTSNSSAPTSGWSNSIPSASTAGTYYVWWRINATTGYNAVSASCLTSKINQATNSWTTNAVKQDDWTYNNSNNSLFKTAPVAKFGSVSYRYKKGNDAWSSYSTTVPSIKDVGNYSVEYKVDAATSYTGLSGSFNVSVSKASNPLNFVETQDFSKTYSTSSQNITITSATSGQGSLVYSILSQPSGNYFSIDGTTLSIGANTPVGVYVLNIRASAAGNSNYESGYKDSTITVTIEKATTNNLSVNITNWTYGDSANSPSSTADFGTATYTYSDTEDGTYTATVPSTPGTYYVKATIAETTNYVGATATKSFTIAKKPLTITAGSDSKEYDGSPLTKNSYSNTTLVTDDSIESVTVTGSQTNAGSSNNVPSLAVIKNGNNDVTDYYNITYTNGTLTVTQAKTNNVSVNITGWTYYSQPSTPITTADFGLTEVIYTYSDSLEGTYTSTVPSNAGTYYIKATIPETPNYVGNSAIKLFVIEPKEIKIAFDANIEDATLSETERIVKIGNPYVKYNDLPTPTKQGYSFIGWTLTKDGTDFVTAYSPLTGESESHTLYAKWYENKHQDVHEDLSNPGCTYTIVDADEAYPDQDVAYNASTTNTLIIKTDVGYVVLPRLVENCIESEDLSQYKNNESIFRLNSDLFEKTAFIGLNNKAALYLVLNMGDSTSADGTILSNDSEIVSSQEAIDLRKAIAISGFETASNYIFEAHLEQSVNGDLVDANVQLLEGQRVSISIKVPNGLLNNVPANYSRHLAIAHLVGDGKVVIYPVTVENGWITFETDSFSPFAIIYTDQIYSVPDTATISNQTSSLLPIAASSLALSGLYLTIRKKED